MKINSYWYIYETIKIKKDFSLLTFDYLYLNWKGGERWLEALDEQRPFDICLMLF